MDGYIESLGHLGFTLRLKRLADRCQEDGRRLYESLEMPLEPNWYAMLLLLRRSESQSVTQVAARLGMKHPSVIDAAKKMERAGLLSTEPDPADGRRRLLRLSDYARERMPEFEKVWEAFRDELSDLLKCTGDGLLDGLRSVEENLVEKGLDRRVLQRLASSDTRKPCRRDRLTGKLDIRPLERVHRAAVVQIGRELVRFGNTYAYDPDISDDELWRYWSPRDHGKGYAAVHEREVVAIFVIRPSHPGPGSHVANGSYAVRADMRGLGLGRRIGLVSLQIAAETGFEAMQFNTVVSTNRNAMKLWQSLGFRVVGTIPEGFRLPDGRLVAHHIMYRSLK